MIVPGQQISLWTARARSLGLTACYCGKTAVQFAQQCSETFALKGLEQQIAAGTQTLSSQVQGQFRQVNPARLIYRLDSTGIGGHIGNYKVYGSAGQQCQQAIQSLLL